MKKQIMILAVCLIVAAALGGALWFLMGYEPEGTSSSSSYTVDESLQLNQKSLNDLDSLKIQNETGSYTIRYLGDSQYTLQELENAPLNNSMLSSATSPAAAVVATSLVTETPGNLSDFGLQSPRATLTARYTDGSEFTLELGSDAPGNNGIYGKVKGSDAVYLLSSYTFSNALKDKFEYVDLTVTEQPATSEMDVLPERIVLGGSLRPEELVIERNSGASDDEKTYGLNLYRISAPKSRAVDSDSAVEALQSLLSISAESAVAYQPDEAQLAEYGLDTPYSTAAFTYLDGEENTLSVSLSVSAADTQGFVYLLRDDRPVVYRMKAADLPWYDMTYGDFAATLQLLPYIDSVRQVTVEASAGKTYIFDFEGEGDELQFKSNGKVLDDKQFRQYYQSLIGMPSEEYTEAQPPDESEALLKITFTYRDASKKPDYIALLPGPTRRLFLSINGEAEFYTRSSYLDTILSNSEKILAGETVDPLY